MATSDAPRLLLVLGLCLSGCGSAPPTSHRHQATVMLTVTDAALLPNRRVTTPAFSTVVFANRTGRPIAVAVDRAACNECDTVLGFTAADHGARATAVPPGEVVSLCFHEAGVFAFSATVGERVLDGTIEVTAP